MKGASAALFSEKARKKMKKVIKKENPSPPSLTHKPNEQIYRNFMNSVKIEIGINDD